MTESNSKIKFILGLKLLERLDKDTCASTDFLLVSCFTE